MPERLINNLINEQQRQEFIDGIEAFSKFSPENKSEISNLFYEVHYYPGDSIVTQDSLIDSIYLITRGRAEVIQKVKKISKLTHKEKIVDTPIATVSAKDTIGLSDTGFFSPSGKRAASIIAVSEVRALVLDLKDLHAFLSKHPELQSAMYADSGHMLRIRLIKQSLPFSRLSHERLEWLAKQVEEIIVPAGEIIFKQGEIGDRCYLIRSGQVEITSENNGESSNVVASLKSPTLFGEATLITHSPRNATARAIEECDLLVLKHEYLSELIESEYNVATMFMTLMVDRSRPTKNPTIIAHHRMTADKQPIVILKNPETSHYFKLSAEGWFIWEQLNGKQTMQAVTLALADKFNIFAPDVVAGLISKLAKEGFVQNVEIKKDALPDQPAWVRSMLKLKNLLETRIVIGDADKWINAIYKKIRYLFSPVGLFFLSVLAIAGFVAFGFATSEVILIFRAMPNSWLLLVLMVPFTLLSVALHELGHALVMKAIGYEVHYMGVGWYWLAPVAFTDTSEMWLSGRWPRTAVNLAGIGMDILTAGIASLLIFAIPSLYVKGFLWVFAIFTYISAFRMLNPLQELDGYYVLMDAVDRNHLRHRAVAWLVKDRSLKKHMPEIVYWLACIVFLILVSLLTIFVQTFIFKVLGFKPSNPLISLALPFLVVIVSCLGIFADIRSESEE